MVSLPEQHKPVKSITLIQAGKQGTHVPQQLNHQLPHSLSPGFLCPICEPSNFIKRYVMLRKQDQMRW